MKRVENLIIGAGPAGLAVAGRMRKAGLDFHIIEKAEHVGERWRHHYDRLHLHSVKKRSHLPHLPFPDHYPLYVSRKQVVDYLEEYARHFMVEPHFGIEVTAIQKADNGQWDVRTNNGDIKAGNVIVSTGVNNRPNLPRWTGMEVFAGTVMHSIDYKNPGPFLTGRVLVIGMGNTGAEIALDLAEHEVPVSISVRSPLSIVPRDLNGRPVQETGYLLAKLPFGIGDWLGARVQDVYFGNLRKYGIHRLKTPPAVIIRETGKTPVIDIGTIRAIKQGKIEVVGDVVEFTHSGVLLDNNEHLEVDHIILATGYNSGLGDIVENMQEFLDKNGYPDGPVGTGFHEGLYFVGFNDYKLGGILGTIYTDSEVVVKHLLNTTQRE